MRSPLPRTNHRCRTRDHDELLRAPVIIDRNRRISHVGVDDLLVQR